LELHDADSGFDRFRADVASAKSFYSDVLRWETDDQPTGRSPAP
jgi:predicted enzyme related to lactoylglutathione lyase